jgi:serine/threonine-protein phosphatase CPPED1
MPTLSRCTQRQNLLALVTVLVAFPGGAMLLAGDGSVAVHRRDVSKDRPFEPFVFVQAGDPQMGFGLSLDRDRKMFIKLGKRAKELSAAFVLVCGDLVHKGSRADWEAFDAALATFDLPTPLVPGNHDLANMQTLTRYRSKYGPDHYRFTYNNCTFIGVNTMTLIAASTGVKDDPKSAAAWQQQGRKQWQWLEDALAEAKKVGRTHVFLLMHHPPFAQKEDEKDSYHAWPAKQRKRVCKLIRDYGIRSVFHGHTHKTYELQPDDKAFPLFSLAGTAKAYDKNGFALRLVSVDKDGVTTRLIRVDR